MARVCMVAYTRYSTDTRVRREAEALVERGDSVDMICLGDVNDQEREFLNGVRLIKIRVKRYRGSNSAMYLISYLLFFFSVACRLIDLHLRNHYQVIQVHTMPDFMVFVAIIPKLLGVKVLLDVHDLMPELYQSKFRFPKTHPLIRFITMVERCSIGFADQAIAVHKPHLDVLCSHGNPRSKFTILLNVPDKRLFTNDIKRPKKTVQCFILIYHGTVAKRHGLEIAIRAVSTLKNELEGLTLRIVGDGDDIPRLSKLVSELNLHDVVHISAGSVPMEELVPELQCADVGIVPVLHDDFTKYMLPVKLLEYTALHIPVICSRTETIEAYFDDSMVQFTSAGSVSELTDNIRFLFHNPERRRELSENSNIFNQKYNWETQKYTYYRLIDSLVKGNWSAPKTVEKITTD